MQKRVLHVINGEFYAGAERVQDLLALNLPKFGYQVDFASLKHGLFAQQRAATESPVYPLEMQGKLDFGAARRLAALIGKHDYQIIHAHTPRSLFAMGMVPKSAGSPRRVYHVHGPTLQDTEFKLRNFINSTSERFFSTRIDLAIPVSGHAYDYARSIGIPATKLRRVPNGVPTAAAIASNPDSIFTVGCAALFRPRKGLEILIEAFSVLVGATGQECRLRLIGGFETEAYRHQIESLADQYKISAQIDWVGHTDDVYAELQQLSAFVLPSLYGEGMPMVILEAMANGVPVAASRAGGIGEMLDHDDTGLLCEPGDAGALAHLLTRLANDQTLRIRLGMAGHLKHRNEFSAEAMAAKTAAEYDRLLATSQA